MRQIRSRADFDARVAFARAVAAEMTGMGATLIEAARGEIVEPYARAKKGERRTFVHGHGGEFTIETRFGALRVTAYDSWIACRFDEPKRASSTGCNDYSGKWNFHYSEPPGATEAAAFAARVRSILPDAA